MTAAVQPNCLWNSVKLILQNLFLDLPPQTVDTVLASFAELIGSLKLGNVWVFKQLIFSRGWPMNQLNRNLNIAELETGLMIM